MAFPTWFLPPWAHTDMCKGVRRTGRPPGARPHAGGASNLAQTTPKGCTLPTQQPTCPGCGADLVPGLGCCARQAAAIAAGHRRPVIAQRVVRKAPMPRDLPYATGKGARKPADQYMPHASQVWRTHGAPTHVGHGVDNYGMARNTTLLRK